MSNQELDNLFKNKLEELEKRPSAEAWKKIQTGIKKEKQTNIWYYGHMAAAAVTLIVCAMLWFNIADNKPMVDNEQLAENKAQHTKSEVPASERMKSSAADTATDSKQSSLKAKENDPTAQGKNSESQWAASEGRSATKQRSKTEQPQEYLAQNENSKPPAGQPLPTGAEQPSVNNEHVTTSKTVEAIAQNENNALPHATIKSETASTKQSGQKGQTLVFDIEDFDSKNTVTSNNDNAAIKDKKPSTIKKVLEFAKSVKESDTGLGELREAKNDLFALNFKKDDSK